MGVAVSRAGKVVVVLRDVVTAEVMEHLRNGYPALFADVESLTTLEYPDDQLPPGAPADPPVPPTPAELAAAEAKEEQDVILQKIVLVAFNHENRLRVLEGKTPVTRQQFIGAVKAL